MWVQIDNEVLNRLKKVDDRVPNQEYGEGQFKPFFELFTVGDLTYIANVSSYKERHKHYHEDFDFIKIRGIHRDYTSMIFLNVMFPVLTKHIQPQSRDMIKERISFGREEYEIETYMKLLDIEEKAINLQSVPAKGARYYNFILTDSNTQKYDVRALPFLELESEILKMEIENQFEDNHDIKVKAYKGTFLVDIDETEYTLTYHDFEKVGFLKEVHEYSMANAHDVEFSEELEIEVPEKAKVL